MRLRIGAFRIRIVHRASIWLFLTCLVWSASVSSAEAQQGWVDFVHPQYGFTLQYPPDWQRAQQVSPQTLILLFGPPSASSQRGRLSVGIGAPSTLGESATAETFADLMNNVLRRVFDRYVPDRRETVQLGTTVGVIQHYTFYPLPGLQYYEVALYVVEPPNRGWIVKGSTDANSARLAEEIALLLPIILTFRLSVSSP